MRRRLFRIAVLAILLAPGLWIRSDPPPVNTSQKLSYSRIVGAIGHVNSDVEVVGAWKLYSANTKFGGFSSLVTLGRGEFFSASDRGDGMRFPAPQRKNNQADVTIARFAPGKETDKFLLDIEGLTRNSATGQLWATYEDANAIQRFDRALKPEKTVRPEAMQDWKSNSGPESITRLNDGRFLVFSEGATSRFGEVHKVLIFPNDPVKGAKPEIVSYRPPQGFLPVDAATLPDGRVLILLRALSWMPPGFHSALAVADPSEIKRGETWQGQMVARLTAPVPPENYEGLAIAKSDGGVHDLWLISDDNVAKFQDTILLHLRWTARKR